MAWIFYLQEGAAPSSVADEVGLDSFHRAAELLADGKKLRGGYDPLPGKQMEDRQALLSLSKLCGGLSATKTESLSAQWRKEEALLQGLEAMAVNAPAYVSQPCLYHSLYHELG